MQERFEGPLKSSHRGLKPNANTCQNAAKLREKTQKTIPLMQGRLLLGTRIFAVAHVGFASGGAVRNTNSSKSQSHGLYWCAGSPFALPVPLTPQNQLRTHLITVITSRRSRQRFTVTQAATRRLRLVWCSRISIRALAGSVKCWSKLQAVASTPKTARFESFEHTSCE